MESLAERRRYQRCTTNLCKVLLSTDEKKWKEAELIDISAGGLRITTKRMYEADKKLYVNLSIYNMLSEFNLRFEAVVLRREKCNEGFSYAVKFVNVCKYCQVQLDEIVKAKLSLRSDSMHGPEDGIYTFLLIPRVRPARMRLNQRI